MRFTPFSAIPALALAFAALVALDAPTPSRAAESAPPNLLFIMADDMSASELGCYGHPTHDTPRLDELARTGVRFETCYATPVCSPTRLMLMTGQYGFRNGWTDMEGRPGGPRGGGASRVGEKFTFADLVKGAGYATAVAGKWQLPGDFPTRVHDTGFDEYMIWIYRGYLPRGVEYRGGFEGGSTGGEDGGGRKYARYFHPGVMRNNEHVPTTKDDFGDDLFTDFLIDFMERNREGPFFAYYPMCLTHAPWGPTPDRRDLPERNTPETFEAFVEYADKTVGRLVDALDRLGLRENTIVFFTGDNGTQGAGKYTPTERGVRVPLIVNAPGRVPGGRVSRDLTSLADVLPTFADLTGARIPETATVDGRSFAGAILPPTEDGPRHEPRPWVFSFLSDARILRDDRWLLEWNTPDDFGRLYDCGESRDGTGYADVTESDRPEAIEARARFEAILKELPVPEIDRDSARRLYRQMGAKDREEPKGGRREERGERREERGAERRDRGRP